MSLNFLYCGKCFCNLCKTEIIYLPKHYIICYIKTDNVFDTFLVFHDFWYLFNVQTLPILVFGAYFNRKSCYSLFLKSLYKWLFIYQLKLFVSLNSRNDFTSIGNGERLLLHSSAHRFSHRNPFLFQFAYYEDRLDN